ncbi:MAG TPA: ABC transporter substrate-binding protein, partial [Dehalococcoidia bacterium]|nr:ABC transporter substrate-binding protein [Dehalococcoidia bacterium]
MTSADVKWSWERFTALNPARRIFQNQLSPDSPVTSLTFPDASTVLVKLAFPMGAIIKMFGTRYYMAIYPVEAEDKFDPKQEMRGSGAWMMTKWEPSVGWNYERNPNWFRAQERPFLDGLRYTLIPDAATREAQFLAKKLWELPLGAVGPDQILALKRAQPEVDLLPSSPYIGQSGQNYWVPGRKPGSKWDAEVRLRHAFSMAIDRDAFIDTVYNVSGLEREGVPMEVGWHSHVPTFWPQVWLNPRGKEFGENAKYFSYNPDEAAKLLRAAGLYGFEETMHFASNGLFGGEKENSIAAAMLNQNGLFKFTLRNTDYTTQYTPMIQSKGQFDGVASMPLGGWSDWDLAMWNTFTPSGRNDYVAHDTPELKELMVAHRRELDPKKRLDIVHEWQRQMAKHMVVMPFPGAATAFGLAWPWMGNRGWFQPAGGGVPEQETLIHIWYDKEKDTSTG